MALALLTTTACKDDEEHLSAEPYQVLDRILETNDIYFYDALQTMFSNNGITEEMQKPYKQQIQAAAMKSRAYKAYTIAYHTTDPHGKPIVASGVVYYPKSGKPRGVIEAVSFNNDKYMCPSQELKNIEVLLGMAGYIVVTADHIGHGITTELVTPFFNHDNAVKVNVDLRAAATELVRNVYGHNMPQWTLITGMSLAASEAWALARYYQQHPERGVRVNQIWVCGGAYKPVEVFAQQFRTRFTNYALIPNVIYSVNHYDNLGLDLSQVFRGELSQHYEEWCTGKVKIFELTEMLGTDLSNYLNYDFFNDANEGYLRLKASIEQFSIPNDWVPEAAVHIYHARNDTFVPYESSERLVDYLRSVGVNVDFVVTDNDHTDNCLVMGTDIAKVLY